ncbi:hypothetical protein [Candidatus Contubernalis alkaliaceticus]|uniref:hypothetical protein n=1 Tax=Candidatus Contubernalis alkaliaceticus TaxID=338645 RepID=UPI001F4BE320|nr:hypothetical protein [Candidatus Contubernalis alkalaceticus]UNC92419.1 hypothetical protein HUE98_10090 [Candidatus Contubernalis alkalaceticus]
MQELVKWKWAQPKADTVKIKDNRILWEGEWESKYYPFDFPNMPNALAKVDNAEQAVDFVKRYGFLGYFTFDDEKTVSLLSVGEPLDWFICHAKTVKLVLYLIEAMQNKNEKIIKSIIDSSIVEITRKMLWEGAPEIKKTEAQKASEKVKTKAHVIAEGPNISYTDAFIQTPEILLGSQILSDNPQNKYQMIAILMVSHLIDENTKRVRRTLFLGGKKLDRFMQSFYSRSLIEAIWYMIGDAALLSQEKNGKGIRTCKECGLPFIVTDKRQQFCPGDEYSKGSLCGARYRMRNYRSK